ncbi:peroxidase-like [Macrosteles quadrilineatus]|uniref:peroxidase-like n=1 Tax=Macrosteles quadrilineatus TaxID=74068 RepID=UPI0023E259B0|nr:peroxidase-like [Macrosteles quadrilineatus]
MSVKTLLLFYTISVVSSQYEYPRPNPPHRVPGGPKPYSWPARCFPRVHCDRNARYRSLDGSCNNLWYPAFGMVNTTLVRILPARYSNALGGLPISVTGKQLPLARELRTHLFPEHAISDGINSLAVMTWGQFLAHDVSLIKTNRAPDCCTKGGHLLESPFLPPHCLVVEIPENDKFYKEFGQTCFAFERSATINEHGCIDSPPQQISLQTHFLDLSMVYGKSREESNSLRTFNRGRLKIQELEDGREFLPNVKNAKMACQFAKFPNDTCFLAGDVRVNQQPSLTVLHTIFLREHNMLADQLYLLNSHWSDERIFQEARRILIAQYQHITYSHFLPLLLGLENTIKYKLFPRNLGYGFGYNEHVNPGTLNIFTTAAYRSLHSIVPGRIQFPMEVGECPQSSRPLSDLLNRPAVVLEEDKFDSLLRGLSRQAANQMDPYFTHQITNLLFRPEGRKFGIDLESTDIMRGRDHGLPSYNTVRKACGMRRARHFHEFEDTMTKSAWKQLEHFYEHVDDVDLYVGGVMEDLVPNALVGPVFQCIVAEQFRRWRNGDRFFYEFGGQPGSFRLDQLDEIRKASLALLICRNSDDIARIQRDPFSQPSSR